jgi:uncharacterized protein (TIGR00369 family)
MPDAPPPSPTVDLAALQDLLCTRVAPWVMQLGMRVESATPGEVVLALPIAPVHVHGGGVLCGQTLMAAADTAMVLAISSQLGGFRPMTTVQLQTSFLRPIAGSQAETVGQVRVVARVLRAGKSLVFGEVEVLDAQGRLAAHSTTTYALL